MGRKRKVSGGRLVAIYISDEHEKALIRHQRERGFKSVSEAARDVLDSLVEVYRESLVE